MKRLALLILAALLAGPVLWAQSDASTSGGTAAATGAAAGTTETGGASQGTGTATTSSGTATTGSGEDEFFGSGQVEAKQGAAETPNAAEAVEKERLGFSGQLQTFSTYTVTRNFVQEGWTNPGDNVFLNTIMGDFLVDARLPKSFRMFLDLNINYIPTGVSIPITFTQISPPPVGSLIVLQNQNTLLDIKEVFVDFNFANTVYFRAGKQVLQWGTGYFWNPTDLINIAHKSFTNLNALLDGVFGLRTDVTFSPNFHLYTFINLNGVTDLTEVAYAARTEFLAGTVEFGFSGWYQYNRDNQVPVFGADLTTPLFWELNLTGEASFAWGDPVQKMNPTTGQPYWVTGQFVPKADIGLSRTFDVLNVVDRVMVEAEFFWNSDGYDQNMFRALGSADLASFLTGYYHAGYYGQYYGALFVTINDFGLPNMSLMLNALCNFSDMSAIALVGLSDSPVSNFTLQLQVGSYLGANDGEYTVSAGGNPSSPALMNNQLFVILSAQVNF